MTIMETRPTWNRTKRAADTENVAYFEFLYGWALPPASTRPPSASTYEGRDPELGASTGRTSNVASAWGTSATLPPVVNRSTRTSTWTATLSPRLTCRATASRSSSTTVIAPRRPRSLGPDRCPAKHPASMIPRGVLRSGWKHPRKHPPHLGSSAARGEFDRS